MPLPEFLLEFLQGRHSPSLHVRQTPSDPFESRSLVTISNIPVDVADDVQMLSTH